MKPYEISEEKRKELLQLLKWSKEIIDPNIYLENLSEEERIIYANLGFFIRSLSTPEEQSKEWSEL